MVEGTLTNAELAILSLVAERERYGYQIEQVLEARGMRAWTEVGFSSIYYLLKKLERRGLVSGARQTRSGPGKARVVYRILPEGRAALARGVRTALSQPQPAPPAFLLGLANLPLLDPDDVSRALAGYLDGLEARKRSLMEARTRAGEAPYFVQAMFEYSTALLHAERRWVRAFKDRVEAIDGEA